VEFAVNGVEFFGCSGCSFRMTLHKALDPVQRRNDRGFPLVVSILNRCPQRLDFQDAPQADDLGEVVSADIGNAETPLARRYDETRFDQSR